MRGELFEGRLTQELWGIRFPKPVGLAAGFDKNAAAYPALATMGFGFIEVGTVTFLPQSGNPRPRIHRFPKDQALVNYMGFPNVGAYKVADNMHKAGTIGVPLGISLGKSSCTHVEDASLDCISSLRTLYKLGDYFTVCVSCPNSPGVRELQHKKYLFHLLKEMVDSSSGFSAALKIKRKPVLVKISPDLSRRELDDVLEAVADAGVDGIVATNTTADLDVLTSGHSLKAGGVSGAPLFMRMLEKVGYIRANLKKIPIIGVGGIMSSEDAYETLAAGANLVQIYTSFIYNGPSAANEMNAGILALLRENNFRDIREFNRFFCRLLN